MYKERKLKKNLVIDTNIFYFPFVMSWQNIFFESQKSDKSFCNMKFY